MKYLSVVLVVNLSALHYQKQAADDEANFAKLSSP